MRGVVLSSVGGGLVLAWLAVSGPVSAQGSELVLLILPTHLTKTSEGGVDILRAINAPVETESGQIVGTANVTSFVRHPELSYFPTFLELTSGERRIFVNRLVSRDARFRRAYAFEVSGSQPVNFFRVGMVAPVELPQGNTPFVFTLRQEAFGPSPGQNYDHVFDFLSPRPQAVIGDTALAYRLNSRWSLAQGGAKIPVGGNFSFSYANNRGGSANFLQLDANNGALVFCGGVPQVCGTAGVGGFDGTYGGALSRLAGELGVPGDAFSTTPLTHQVSGTQPSVVTCPPGVEPRAPTDVLATKEGSGFLADYLYVSWGGVVCAVAYDVEITDVRGTRTVRVDSTNFSDSASAVATTSDVRVAGVSAEGRRGPFTQGRIQPVLRRY